MSVLVKGWSIPTDGCCGCYFRTGKYCGILSKNERVLKYAERFTRPDNCPLTELIRCKDCRFFETNHWEKVNKMPLIVAHEICTRWGKGCKTAEDGFCFMAERKEE